MEARVQKWGNSLAIRIPKLFAAEAGLQQNSPIEVLLEGKRLMVVPIAKPTVTLEQLLAGVTERNLHAEVDTGPAVGGEVW